MKNFETLNTDFYQISMAMAYLMDDKANETTGFEGFIRHVKTAVNPNENFYIFDGADNVIQFIDTLRKEIVDPEFKEVFWSLIEPKITASNIVSIRKTFDEKWSQLIFDFEYRVVPNGTVVFPLVPVFQYKGPKIWGQIIETYGTNIYNGKTALATIKYLKENGESVFIGDDEFEFIEGIINNDTKAIMKYEKSLRKTAKKFRDSTDKVLLEAAFRRCPTKVTADMASLIAIQNGWDGTSNVGIFLKNWITADKIGGTMAHAFVMSYENENDAFRAWDRIFPGTTMLIDTYDVENAARNIRKMAGAGEITMPREVRIDSDPLEDYCFTVDKIFEGTDTKVLNFVSGDMNIAKFEHFEAMNVPYGKAMVGTKYVYDSMIVEKLNSGFVYKIVEFTKENGDIIRPLKKANGKGNYAGLKQSSYNEIKDELSVWCGTSNGTFGFSAIEKVTPNTKVVFIGTNQ
mgnify:CR=1 FL=1